MQKILIVDDSASVRESFLDILSPLAECETAGNGREAVDRIKGRQGTNEKFHLVIMDIIMPETDGLTAVKEIRDYEKEQGLTAEEMLTVVIVTTITDPSRILVAQYECGADAYITKPFTRETVLQVMSNNGLKIPPEEHDIADDPGLWSYSK